MESDDAAVLHEFLSAENSQGLYDLLLDLIDKHRLGESSVHQEINLNVFDLEIDHSTGMVSIHDILAPRRVAVVPLVDVLARLQPVARTRP